MRALRRLLAHIAYVRLGDQFYVINALLRFAYEIDKQRHNLFAYESVALLATQM